MISNQHIHYYKYFLTIVTLLFSSYSRAQQPALQGIVVDNESKKPMSRATLQLYRPGKRDTVFIAGTLSDVKGAFSFKSLSSGDYLLKTSFLGYQPQTKRVTVAARRTTSLGQIALTPEAIRLKEAIVTANLPKMDLKDDTVVYNAEAFSVPE